MNLSNLPPLSKDHVPGKGWAIIGSSLVGCHCSPFGYSGTAVWDRRDGEVILSPAVPIVSVRMHSRQGRVVVSFGTQEMDFSGLILEVGHA